MSSHILTALLALSAPALAAADPADPAGKPQPIDLVICLDTSNSMDGLIDSAKLKLWDIVNDMAKVQPAPDLRVALYSYGNDTYDPAVGWVRKELDLSRDLDEVYNKLNALTTNGGTEYATRVSRDALEQLAWSDRKDALKILFVCGNEEAEQDPLVTLDALAEHAKAKGVFVNTIYCGAGNDGIAPNWNRLAQLTGGKGTTIDQDQARNEPQIESPFDKKILELNQQLNKTYLAYGAMRQLGLENQAAQDNNADKAAPAAALGRAQSKAGALYRNSTWDLVDRCKEDPNFDISKVKDEELPEELRKLSREERVKYVEQKRQEREKIQKEILDLSAQRQAFVAEELKKLPRTEGERAFDDAVKSLLREQADTKGIKIPK